MADGDVTAEGWRLISLWIRCNEGVERARESMYAASRDRDEIEKALVAWMLPEDAKPGEKICVWFGDSLIQVEKGGVVSGGDGDHAGCMSSTKVTVRKRGKHFDELK